MTASTRPDRRVVIALPRTLAAALTLVAALALACAPRPAAPAGDSGALQGRAAGLDGRWTLCMTETTQGTGPLCATLSAERRSGDTGAEYYAVTHELPLDSLLRTAHRPPPYGVLAAADSGRWRLLLGVDEGVVSAFDVGLHGTLAPDGDSLAGTWSHSCFAGCPEQGRAVLRR
jgi:hypothetical protein